MRTPRQALIVATAFIVAGVVPPASGVVPSLKTRFGNLPCLAPIIRQIDPEAPNSVEESLVLPPYQAPRLRDDIGEVNFPITVGHPDAQAFFNQGVALLHTFQYTEADRAFRQVVSLDPGAPMGYWGLALANELYPRRAEVFLQRANFKLSERAAEVTPRERAWMKVYLDYYRPETERLTKVSEVEARARREDRLEALEDLVYAFPEDVEARAFYLRHLTLDEYRGGVRIRGRLGAESLAVNLFADHPRHPGCHYRTFLWLNEHPERALDTVARGPVVSPGIPDAWRYAAEVYRAAGRFPEALLLQEACLRVAHRQCEEDLLMPVESENLGANYAAYIDTLCSVGRVDDAIAMARRLIDLPAAANPGMAVGANKELADSRRTGRRMLVETLMRHGRWQELLETCESPVLDAGGDWDDRAHRIYWMALAHLNLEQREKASEREDELDGLIRNALKEGTTGDVEKELGRCLRSLRTYMKVHDGNLSAPPNLKKQPLLHVTGDHLARLYMRGGLTEAAIETAKADLAGRPHQVLAIANCCDLLIQAERMNDAKLLFDRRFRSNAALADADLDLLQNLQPLISELKIRGNWKLAAPVADLPKELPEIESLGPLDWVRSEAPSWSLPDHRGEKIALEDYKGKPVLVVFFLGVGCVYCIEQLNVFTPHIEAYEKAGIPIVAVSTDTVDTLAAAMGGGDEKGEDKKPAFAFPIVSDADGKVAKAYRAYDDFSDKGLHATVLIGPEGEVVWKDAGHEPYLLPEILLGESVRLLGEVGERE